MSDIFNDKTFILDRSQWPGDGCCLKQRNRAGERSVMGYRAYGVIFSARPPIEIYSQDTGATVAKYESVDAMLADGWRVD